MLCNVCIEIISSIPNLVIVVLMLVVLKPGMTSIILAIAISSWTTMARMIRAETLSLKTQEYVLAARTLGESPTKIAWKHLVPKLIKYHHYSNNVHNSISYLLRSILELYRYRYYSSRNFFRGIVE